MCLIKQEPKEIVHPKLYIQTFSYQKQIILKLTQYPMYPLTQVKFEYPYISELTKHLVYYLINLKFVGKRLEVGETIKQVLDLHQGLNIFEDVNFDLKGDVLTIYNDWVTLL